MFKKIFTPFLILTNLFRESKPITPTIKPYESNMKRVIRVGQPYWKVWGLSKRPDSLRKQQFRCFGTFSPVKRFK